MARPWTLNIDEVRARWRACVCQFNCRLATLCSNLHHRGLRESLHQLIKEIREKTKILKALKRIPGETGSGQALIAMIEHSIDILYDNRSRVYSLLYQLNSRNALHIDRFTVVRVIWKQSCDNICANNDVLAQYGYKTDDKNDYFDLSIWLYLWKVCYNMA